MGTETSGRNELDKPKSLREFWPYYVCEHLDPLNRFLHALGSTLVIVLFVAVLLSGVWWGLLLLPVIGYGFAWIGHFFVQKNKPATFHYPVWSFICDFIMVYKIYNNTMDEEVEKIKKQKGLVSVVLLLSFSFALSLSSDLWADEEDMKQLNPCERYEDFYNRKKLQEAAEVEKNRGIMEIKKEREEAAREAEFNREEWARTRKQNDNDTELLEAAYLKEQKEQRNKELAIEREYSRHMDKVQQARQSHCSIPENEEYGLEQ